MIDRKKVARQENEIKLSIPSPQAARRRIRQAGFQLVHPRTFESNTVFDTPGSGLLARGELLRVRRFGKQVVLTHKGPAHTGKHRTREETEVELSDAAAFERILRRLGFHPVFRYEKYRTEYAKPGEHGMILVDETPIGAFLELEGGPRWIDRTARALGFSEADYITKSYGGLYQEWCERNGVPRGHMVFAAHSGR
ncbi:MAG: class IV adenylate cyclase [Bryobacteraceae bacterium]